MKLILLTYIHFIVMLCSIMINSHSVEIKRKYLPKSNPARLFQGSASFLLKRIALNLTCPYDSEPDVHLPQLVQSRVYSNETGGRVKTRLDAHACKFLVSPYKVRLGQLKPKLKILYHLCRVCLHSKWAFYVGRETKRQVKFYVVPT